MKTPTLHLFVKIVFSAFALFVGQSTYAASYWWGNATTSGLWSAPGNWWTTANGTVSGAAPGASDTATFNGNTVNATETVQLGAATSILGMTFVNTGTTEITSNSTTSRALTIGTGGITINSGAGAVTIGNATNPATITLGGSQTWTNNSINTTTIVNTVSRSAGQFLNIAGTGTFTAANAFALSNGIVGPWATTGSGTSLSYVTKSLSVIGAYSGGTPAATAADLTDTTGAVNYDLADATGTIGAANFSGNTIRYTGAAATLAPGATSFTVNGLMNSGTGKWTIGANPITIGSTKEMLVTGNTQDIEISSVIKNNGANASSLAYSGGGTLTLSGNNTFTGGLNIGAGTVLLNNAGAVNSTTTNPVAFTGNAGTLTLNGNSVAITGLSSLSALGASGSTNLIVQNANAAGATLTVGGINTSSTFYGVLQNGTGGGTLALTKQGSGTLDLFGANSIGNVTVSAGTLSVRNNSTFSNVSVAGTLALLDTASPCTVNINGLSGSGAVTTSGGGGGNRILYIGNGDASADFSGVITKVSNRGLALFKTGTGTQTLSGASANVDQAGSGSFSTTVQAGTLILNKTGVVALPGASVTISGGTLQISGTGGNQIANTAGVTLSGGTFDLGGLNETVGAVSITAAAASGDTIKNGNLTGTSYAASNATGNAIVSANLLGSAITLAKSGAGSLTLAGANTYSGATSVTGGTLNITGTNSGSGNYTVGAASANATLTINSSGTVSASGLALTAATSPSYVVNFNGGIFNVGSGGISATANNGSINFAGGTLKSSAAFAISGGIPININTGGAVIDTTGGSITSSSAFLVGTGGGVTVQGGNTLTLPGSNAYTGGTIITGNSTLKLGSSSITGLMTINSGSILDLGNASSSVGGLAGAGTVLNTGASSAKTLTLTGTGGNNFSGVIGNGSGTGTDTYTGAVINLTSGTQTLSGTNTYAGGTTLTSGTLSVGATANLGAAASSLTFNGGTLQITGTTLTNFSGIGHSVSFTAAKTVGLDINNAGNTFTVDQVLNQTTGGFTKLGAGTAILNQSNTYTGTTTVNAGTLELDFTASGAPASNIINSTGALTLGGGTLNLVGNATSASSQTFASTSLTAGGSVISAAPASGSNIPTLALGSLSANQGPGATIRFDGPATINGAGNVAATGIITTTTAGTGTLGNMGTFGLGKNGAYATVGLYDWASTSLANGTAGTSPYTIIGGSQVTGFYQTTGITTGGNYDVKSTGVNSIGNAGGATTLRFNTSNATSVSFTTTFGQNMQGILVTPNMGANNVTVGGAGILEFVRSTGGGNSYGVIWQNNTSAYLKVSVILGAGRQAGQYNGLTQAGPGTVFYTGVNTYELASYLNGGYSVINANSGFGAVGNGSALNLSGGTVVGNATFSLDNSGANLRPINLLSNGGGLAATAGNTLTATGVVSGATGTGPLTIGIPASGANGNVAGVLPGSGVGTANTTAVLATGTVKLSGANTFTGDTNIVTGTLEIGDAGTLGSGSYAGAISIASGALFKSSSSANQILSGSISGGGDITKTGAGTLTLSGASTYTGQTDVQNGILQLTGSLSASTALNLGNGVNSGKFILGSGTGAVNQTVAGLSTAGSGASNAIVGGNAAVSTLTASIISGTNTFAGILGGTGTNENNLALTKSGAGNLILSGANTYTGLTTVSSGILKLGASGALGDVTNHTSGVTVSGSGIFDLGGITPTYNVPLILNSTANGFDVGAFENSGASATYGGTVTLQQQTRFGGTGAILLTGAITGGGFKIIKDSTGLLELQNSGTVTLGDFQGNRGTLQVDTGSTLNLTNMDIGTGGSVGAGLTLNGGNVTSSGLSRFGQGTGSASGTLTLNGGTLTVSALTKGTLTFNANFNGGTLKASSDNATFFASATSAKVQAGGAKIDDGGFTITIGQPLIHDSVLGATVDGGLAKTGAGNLTLTGISTYTGNTTVSSGNLIVSGSGNLTGTEHVVVTGGSLLIGANEVIKNSANVTMSNGGTLAMAAGSSGLTETLGSLTLTSNSTIDFGASNGGNTFWFTGAFTGAADQVLSIANWTYGIDHLAFTTDPGDLSHFEFNNGFAATVQDYNGGFEIIAIPEPGTIFAGLLLLGGLCFAERRRLRGLAAAGSRSE